LKKKILLIFPDNWLQYSPTTINIFNSLKYDFDVTLVAIEPDPLSLSFKSKIKDDRILYCKATINNRFLYLFLNSLLNIYNYFAPLNYRLFLHKLIKAKALAIFCKNIKFDEIIAFDTIGFYVAKNLHNKINFVSLEISKDDYFYFNLKKSYYNIKSVLIQNYDRLKILDINLLQNKNIFFVQNAPISSNNINIIRNYTNQFIYMGSGNLSMGIGFLIDYARKFPNSILTLKGNIDLDFLKNSFFDINEIPNLFFDDSYLENESINTFLSNYSIGFCFYDFNHISPAYRENRLYGPAGKIFNYFASGIPIIASNIPGFQIINENNAGILLENPSPENIENAVLEIKNNYDYYSRNSFNASKRYCFNHTIKPFLNLLKS
jgi:glycosyltransferase involved in cell wall biosynthesis